LTEFGGIPVGIVNTPSQFDALTRSTAWCEKKRENFLEMDI
jgi:hypothetical protein